MPVDRTDSAVIERAAAALQHRTIQDGYAGLVRKDLAFGRALVFDELGMHLRELDDDVPGQALQTCRILLRGPDS